MRRLPTYAALLCAAAAGIAGCGGDDGLARTEQPELMAPARPSGDDSLPSVEGDGLLYPKAKKHRKAKKRHERKHADKKKHERKRGRKHARQQVAGVEETHRADGGTLTSTGGEPPIETGSLESNGHKPLSRDQQADLESVKASLGELFSRLNARDASVCTDLMTQRHVEEATGKTGPEAVEQCRSDVAGSKLSYSLNKIAGVRVVGDLAWITFASSAGNYARWQTLRAVRNGAGWRFDGDGSGDV